MVMKTEIRRSVSLCKNQAVDETCVSKDSSLYKIKSTREVTIYFRLIISVCKIVMELQDVFYNNAEYIETASGNKVSRQSVLCGSQNIVINGKTIIMTDCVIRGDLANVRIGRHCIVSRKAVIRPPFKKFSKGVAFFPIHIGDNVFIGEDSIVNAAQVGSFVHIGKNCVIGRRCVLKDCCAIADNTVLPPETVVPPFTVFSGSPGRFTSELPECTQDLMIDVTMSYYDHFKSIGGPKSRKR